MFNGIARTSLLAVATRSSRLTRPLHSTGALPSSSSSSKSEFDRPGPPRLPEAEQKAFEELVKKANMPLSASGEPLEEGAIINDEDLVHPDAPKRAKPQWEGEVNPVTGERGGPKQEPLMHGDWSYGGKVSDF